MEPSGRLERAHPRRRRHACAGADGRSRLVPAWHRPRRLGQRPRLGGRPLFANARRRLLHIPARRPGRQLVRARAQRARRRAHGVPRLPRVRRPRHQFGQHGRDLDGPAQRPRLRLSVRRRRIPYAVPAAHRPRRSAPADPAAGNAAGGLRGRLPGQSAADDDLRRFREQPRLQFQQQARQLSQRLRDRRARRSLGMEGRGSGLRRRTPGLSAGDRRHLRHPRAARPGIRHVLLRAHLQRLREGARRSGGVALGVRHPPVRAAHGRLHRRRAHGGRPARPNGDDRRRLQPGQSVPRLCGRLQRLRRRLLPELRGRERQRPLRLPRRARRVAALRPGRERRRHPGPRRRRRHARPGC